MEVALLAEVGLPRQQSLARLPGIARAVAKRQPKRIGGGNPPAKIPRQGRVAEEIVRPLSFGREITGARRVVKWAQQTAQLAAAVPGVERAAITLERKLGRSRRAAMRENLHHTVHCVRAVESTRGAVHNFDLVHVLEREVREIN